MRNSIKTLFALAAIALTFSCPTGSQAAITTYTSQVDFNNALISGSFNSYTETFDSLSTSEALDTTLNFSGNGLSYQASAVVGGTTPDPFFAAANGSDIYLSTNSDNDVITFTLVSTTVTAIGGNFFLTDLSGTPVEHTVALSLNGGPVTLIENVTPTSFLGFISTEAITSLSFFESPEYETQVYLTANNLTVAEVIPEPSSVTMLLLGAGLVVGYARKRARQRKNA